MTTKTLFLVTLLLVLTAGGRLAAEAEQTGHTETTPTPQAETQGPTEAQIAQFHQVAEEVANASRIEEQADQQAAHAAHDSDREPHATTEEPTHADTPHEATADGHATPATHKEAVAHSEPKDHATADATQEEIASLLRIGADKFGEQKWDDAELAYMAVLKAHATSAQDREALVGLARTYRQQGALTKATAVYEKIIKEYPGDPLTPVLFLELGRSLRALGAYKLAVNRFYSVINSTLKLPENGADQYRQLARTAQFEIAETYFVAGDYQEAHRFFARLNLLDLAPSDRPKVALKAAESLYYAGETEKGIVSLRSLIQLYPDSPQQSEARYLLSSLLQKQGKYQEALTVAIELLKDQHERNSADGQIWLQWQRKTGNQLANAFYEQGEITSAQQIYERLLTLDDTPSWQIPVLYQLGLCHERLYQKDQAKKCYQNIIDLLKQVPTDSPMAGAQSDLGQMAAWRIKHIEWQESVDQSLTGLFDKAPAPQPSPNQDS